MKKEQNKKEILYNEFLKNKKINEEIHCRSKKIELINSQVRVLQEKLSDLAFELRVLEEIKDSQKTIVAIEDKIEHYLKSLKEKNALNCWVQTFANENENTHSSISSIKNATYTASIIINQNKKRNFYRVDFDLGLSQLLLDSAKEYKHILKNIFDIKIAHEGKVLFNEAESKEYINSIKEKYSVYFEKEKAPILSEFNDTNNNKYKAYDFIQYDDMLIDGFSVMENTTIIEDEEIPF